MDTNKAVESAGKTWKKRDSRGRKQRAEEKDVPGWTVGEKRKTDARQQVFIVHEREALVNPLSTDGTKFFDGFSVGLAAGMPLGAGFRKSVKVAYSVAVIFGSHLQNGMSVTRKIHCPVFCRWSKGGGD